MDGPITRRTFLSVMKGNKDSPNLIIPSTVQALMKRIFSEKGRRRNLFNRVIPQFALKPRHDLNWLHTVWVRRHTPPNVASPEHFVRIIHNWTSQCKHLMAILMAILQLPPLLSPLPKSLLDTWDLQLLPDFILKSSFPINPTDDKDQADQIQKHSDFFLKSTLTFSSLAFLTSFWSQLLVLPNLAILDSFCDPPTSF